VIEEGGIFNGGRGQPSINMRDIMGNAKCKHQIGITLHHYHHHPSPSSLLLLCDPSICLIPPSPYPSPTYYYYYYYYYYCYSPAAHRRSIVA